MRSMPAMTKDTTVVDEGIRNEPAEAVTGALVIPDLQGTLAAMKAAEERSEAPFMIALVSGEKAGEEA